MLSGPRRLTREIERLSLVDDENLLEFIPGTADALDDDGHPSP
jgi:hypothetical protein